MPFYQKYQVSLILTLLFSCSLILRLSYVNSMQIVFPFLADAGKYVQLAYNLANGNGYSLAEVEPFTSSTYITPGYALFLSVFFKHADDFQQFHQMVLNAQALISSVTVVMIFGVAMRLAGLGVAVISGTLVALSPQLIIGSGYVLTETLSSFLLVLSLLVFVEAYNRRWIGLYWLCGIMIGFSALVRPAVLLFPLALLILGVITKTNIKSYAALFLAMLLTWLPWQYWKNVNAQASEVSLMASSFALGGYPDLIYKNPAFKGYPYKEDAEYDQMTMAMPNAVSIVWARAKQQPLKYLQWYLFGKALMYWSPEEVAGPGGPYVYPVISSVYTRQAIPAWTLSVMMNLHPILIFLASITCLCFVVEVRQAGINHKTNPALLITVLLVIYFTAVHTVLAPLPRYSYPLYPIVYVLAAVTIVKLARKCSALCRKTA